ncbi:MAG: hypothetical protein KAH48_05300 [Chlorobi bacterium]|nr:hypothetical protein [Chlorobiota bacterium]
MKKAYLVLIVIVAGFAMNACDSETTEDITKAEIIRVSGCNEFVAGSGIAVETGDSASVSYVYNSKDRTLSLIHVNAAFNCCPRNVSAEFTIVDNVINIREYEVGGDCDCECLYDFDYLVKNIRPEQYQIKIFEPLLSSKDEPFDFMVDLSKSSEGRIVLDRTSYPWN